MKNVKYYRKCSNNSAAVCTYRTRDLENTKIIEKQLVEFNESLKKVFIQKKKKERRKFRKHGLLIFSITYLQKRMKLINKVKTNYTI